MASNEKKLIFTIDPSKAKTGADKVKDYVHQIRIEAEKAEKALSFGKAFNQTGTASGITSLVDAINNLATGFTKATKAQANNTQQISKAEKAYNDALQEARDYNTAIGKSTQFVKVQTSQQRAYNAALIDTLSDSQKMTLAETKYAKQLADVQRKLELVNSALGKNVTEATGALTVKTRLSKVQDELNRSYSEEYQQLIKAKKALADRRKEILGNSSAMTDAEKAAQSLAKSIQFWEQRSKDLNTEQHETLIQLRESARQVEAYKKSLVDALTPAQKLTKAENELNKQMQSNANQINLYKNGLKQKEVAQREELSILKQLAQSEERLKQVYTEEYATLIRNNEAIKKRKRELLGLNDASKKTASGTRELTNSLTAMGGIITGLSFGLMVRDLARMTDEYKALQNRIAVVTGTTEGMTETTRELLEVAQESRVGLDAVADTFSKLSRVNKQYGLSQKELLKVTTTVSQAVSMSGATAQGAQGAMIQFAQALQNNFAAAAQEMNSIIEQTPGLAEAVADAMNAIDGVTTYNIGNIKRAATEGALDVQKVLKGLLLISEEYSNRFKLSQVLLSQGWQQVTNSLTTYIGEADSALGITSTISNVMMSTSKNVDLLGSAVMVLGGAFAGLVGTVSVAGIAAIAGALGIGGPILLGATAIGAAVGAIIAGFIKWRKEVEKTREEIAATKREIENFPEIKSIGLSDREIRGVSFLVNNKDLDDIDKRIKKQVDLVIEARNQLDALNRGEDGGFFGRLFGDDVEDLETKINKATRALEVLGSARALLANRQKDGAKASEEDAKSIENGNKALDEMITKLDPAKQAYANYYAQVQKVVDTKADEAKKQKVINLLYEDLQASLSKSTPEVGRLSDAFQSFRANLDPVYQVQQQYNEAMITLSKHLSQTDPLWRQLAEVIRTQYTKAMKEAKRETMIGIDGIKNRVREAAEYLSSRVTGGNDTGAVDFDSIVSGARGGGSDKRSSASFEKMAQDFLKKLDSGILGPQGAADMLVGLRNYADKLGALGEGFDVEGMKGAVMNLANLAKESFGTADLSDLTAEELAEVFKKAQEEAKAKEERDEQIRTENHENLKKIADWVATRQQQEDQSPKGTVEIVLDNGTKKISGNVSGDSDFLNNFVDALREARSGV